MLTNGGVGDDTDARSCSLSIKLTNVPYTGLTQHPAVLSRPHLPSGLQAPSDIINFRTSCSKLLITETWATVSNVSLLIVSPNAVLEKHVSHGFSVISSWMNTVPTTSMLKKKLRALVSRLILIEICQWLKQGVWAIVESCLLVKNTINFLQKLLIGTFTIEFLARCNFVSSLQNSNSF